ncbi:hypothetical protein B0T25DRAFT_517242 [Lasiosphaeria hispida]|uniref:Uncharacterized protein n=1 Tax=Lasiosphaeria hispida TaxID=260671 RepID=A0AAJ0MGK2_9PEZI|nr:hypothetical protein B0T25DRAFT_517242 [Lasiosphaeria hispida]
MKSPAESKYLHASFWALCNGGNLHSFIQNCRNQGITIPECLSLRFLQHFLETLQPMYTQPYPIFHSAANLENLDLHFPSPESKLPDLYLLNFSTSLQAPFPKTAEWDIPAVMAQISNFTDLSDASHPPTNPLSAAHEMLDELHAEFRRNKHDTHLSDYTADSHTTPSPQSSPSSAPPQTQPRRAGSERTPPSTSAR